MKRLGRVVSKVNWTTTFDFVCKEMCDGMQVVTGLVLAILGVCKEDTGIFTVPNPTL